MHAKWIIALINNQDYQDEIKQYTMTIDAMSMYVLLIMVKLMHSQLLNMNWLQLYHKYLM